MTSNQFRYAIQSGAESVRKNKAISAASIITTAACLTLICALLALGINVRANFKQYEEEAVMLAFIDDTLSTEEARSLQPMVESIEGVASVAFITKEEAYKAYTTEQKESGATPSSRIEPTVFRNRYSIELTNNVETSSVEESLRGVRGVADVRVDESIMAGFASIKRAVQVLSIFLTALMLTICVIIMTNVIKISVYSRREEIAVMKMMGAYNSFIRLPFLCEGCCVGLLGAFTAFILSCVQYQVVCTLLDTGLMSLFEILPLSQVAPILFIVSVALGLGIGIMGCNASVQKNLLPKKRKRRSKRTAGRGETNSNDHAGNGEA